MSLDPEFLRRLQDGRKLDPNAKKKILYFVGPSACGKTSKVEKLENAFGGYYQYITMERFNSFLLKHPNVFIRSLFYLQALMDQLIFTINNAENTNQNTIFVDGHPILSIFQCEAFYQLYEGTKITEKEFNLIKRLYEEIIEYLNKNYHLRKFQQTIYYINIPLEENLRLLQGKNSCEEITEEMKQELLSLRKIIHSNIFNLADEVNDTRVIEVNTLQGLDIINMYLLGSSGCG